MKKRFYYALMAAFIFTAPVLTSCDDDDDEMPPGNAVITIENVGTPKDFVQSGTFGTGEEQTAILPGEVLSFTFHAGKGQALMFATMYAYSNDLFFAPENPGIKLFDNNGNAVTGNVSSHVKLWDNGTRVNQVPGMNVEHPGTAEARNVTKIDKEDAQGNVFPEASELMEVSLAYNSVNSEFTVTIRNISAGKVNETPFSPGVWAVSNMSDGDLVNDEPFFDSGEKSSDALTALAETGNVAPLRDWTNERTGIMTELSKALVVVYSGETNPLFQVGQKDGGVGLKEMVQTGDPDRLRDWLKTHRMVREVYVVGNDPIEPGEKMESTFMAYEGDNIAFVTMFMSSNDWFYANSETIPSRTKGDITNKVALYDSGTAVNQYPGAGNSQHIFGGTPATDDQTITVVGNTYPVPAVSNMIKVTLR